MKNQKWLKVAALSAALLVPSLVFAAAPVTVTEGVMNDKKVLMLPAGTQVQSGAKLQVADNAKLGQAAHMAVNTNLVFYRDALVWKFSDQYGAQPEQVILWVVDGTNVVGYAAQPGLTYLEYRVKAGIFNACYENQFDSSSRTRIKFIDSANNGYFCQDMRNKFGSGYPNDLDGWRMQLFVPQSR